MKVNLLIDNPNVLSGYLNLDPCVMEPGDARIKSDISNLDNYVDDNECEEIRAHEVLTYFDSNKVDAILDNWIKKLRINGIIHICDVDMEEAYKGYKRGDFELLKLNEILFGGQDRKWNLRKCGLTITALEDAFKAKGLKVTKKYFQDYNFVIEGKRINGN